MTLTIKSVGIIGSGTMGQGIAQVCATAGFDTKIYDVNSDQAASAKFKISGALQNLLDKNKIEARLKSEIEQRISIASRLEDLTCDLIIEAAVEDLSVKQTIFKQIESVVSANAILASNTSSISITQIASILKDRSNFAGLHFFNPAPLMKLVEIIKGEHTGGSTVTDLQNFCQSIQKQSVLVQDSPGFIVNRVARHFYVESLKVNEENVAGFKTIDQLLRASGFKMGAFELMDLIGIDVNFAVTSSLYNGFYQDPKFRPSRIQQQKIDAGELGRKSGKGFYKYAE
jgi:3-hydroxybutyryl-CoA dehydrogenase